MLKLLKLLFLINESKKSIRFDVSDKKKDQRHRVIRMILVAILNAKKEPFTEFISPNLVSKTRVDEEEQREKLTFWIANRVVWHIGRTMQTDFGSYQSRTVMHRPLKISYSLSCCRWRSRPIDVRSISMLYWRYWSRVQFRGYANLSPLAVDFRFAANNVCIFSSVVGSRLIVSIHKRVERKETENNGINGVILCICLFFFLAFGFRWSKRIKWNQELIWCETTILNLSLIIIINWCRSGHLLLFLSYHTHIFNRFVSSAKSEINYHNWIDFRMNNTVAFAFVAVVVHTEIVLWHTKSPRKIN